MSLLDGANKVGDLPKIAKEFGMNSIAITDHGSLAGTLEFYLACKKENINPILGIETYLTQDPDGLPKDQRTRDNYHMILLASNLEGWKNLMWLSSNAFLTNFYYKPRISISTLASHANGIIGNSACLASLCSRSANYDAINNVYTDPERKAQKAIGELKEILSGNFYLELMHNPFPQQEAYNTFLIDMAKKTDTKLIISADSHYSRKEDYELHSMIMAMQTKQTLEQYHKGEFHYGPWYYIKSPEEMLASAKVLGCQDAWSNTGLIASQCSLELDLSITKFPIYDIFKDKEYVEYLKR